LKILAAKLSIDSFRGDRDDAVFRLRVGLATALRGLHERKLIHKDVKPTNVLVNSATGQVRLMGFEIASRLRREYQAPEPPEFITGTLPYMAPEQTGRMNRSIDSRCDLYALGVTFYEMLTGDAMLFTLACFYAISATSRNSLKPDGTDHTLRH
jgi:serine/threonine protein kinase